MNETSPKLSLVRSFPLLTLALIAYNVCIAAGHSFAKPAEVFLHVHLISGAEWTLGWNEVMQFGGLLLLFIEIMKSTRAGPAATFEHVLSMFVFIAFLVEFLVVAGAGTSTFMLLGLMSLIDVMAGYAISVAVARKEMNITN